ncbi:MAG: DUF3108 domain-containing protein [Planctomycetota bacterium]|nr:DUF3108 domain-containing protein [Planctomycetota bacterium]
MVAPRRMYCWHIAVLAVAVSFGAAGNRGFALEWPRLFRHFNLLGLSEKTSDEIQEEEKISEALDQIADYRSLRQSMENPDIPLRRYVRPGETLSYQAKWRGLPAGSVRLSAKRLAILKNRPVFVFELTVESNDFLDAFYPINNRINSYVDASNGRSYLLRRNIAERNRRYKDRLEFKYDGRFPNGLPNPVSRYSMVDDQGRETANNPFPISGNMQDVVSSIFCLRGMGLRKEGDVCLLLIGSRQKPVAARIEVVGEERLDLPGLGKFDCLVVEPSAEGANLSGQPLATRGGEKAWLEKHCFVPLQVSAILPSPVGEVVATLVAAENSVLGRYVAK